MISLKDYFEKPHTEVQAAAAADLLERANALVEEAIAARAFEWTVDPDTFTNISGRAGGDGDGGFRTPSSTTGATASSHRIAEGVDVYDPWNTLDKWLDGFEHGQGGNTMLEKHGLYRESPDDTPGWLHVTTRAPASGKRTFAP